MANAQNGKIMTRVRVWDRTTRLFHWINLACVLALMVLGLGILDDDALELTPGGEVLLKTLHVYVGYVFVINLLWRMIWAFIGSPTARWGAMLPFRRGFLAQLRGHWSTGVSAGMDHEPGHSPPGRLMITLLLVLLFAQAMTGLVLAGTDLYKPPFGGYIADWITEGKDNAAVELMDRSSEYRNSERYAEMRAVRKPVKETHEWLFYVLLAAVLMHVAGVILEEFRSKKGLVSAMITGWQTRLSPAERDRD